MITEKVQTQDLPAGVPVFHRILFAVDFSPASLRALRVALPLAAGGARLSVVHVQNVDWRYEMLESPPEINLEEADAEQQLENWINQLRLPCKFEKELVKNGPIAPAIASVAARTEADLLVVGTRCRGGLQKLALGSVAEELLRIAPCPVVTVGPKAETPTGENPFPLRTILFATDFGPGSAKALPLVLTLARQHHSRLVVLHFTPPMPATSTSLSAYAPSTAAADEVLQWESQSSKRSLSQLRAWMSREAGLPQAPEYIVGTDFIPEGLLGVAERTSTDLIVMGASHKGSARVAAHIPWSIVHEVVRDAHCPVLTVAE